jgi:ergothioneine biosynthesis protein EgtB
MNAPDRLSPHLSARVSPDGSAGFSTTCAAGEPQRLLDDYRRVRSATLALAAPLSPEDCQAQSMPDASPVKWHLAHTTWFFETFLLGEFVSGYTPQFAQYRILFNSYYNAVGDKHPRPQRGLLTRPTLAEVIDYRRRVDEAMVAAIGDGAIGSKAFRDLLVLGLHHEQQHQELILTDVKHLLSCNPAGPAYSQPAPDPGNGGGPADSASTIDVAKTPVSFRPFGGGIVDLGHGADGFCFDNELPVHQVLLQPFELADRLVTCAEFLAFVHDGGYRRPEFWLSLGWDRVQAEGWTLPLYWREADGRQAGGHQDAEGGRDATGESAAELPGPIEVFTLEGWQPLEPGAPVAHLSFFEADAYARWAGCRLPTEAEWEHAAGRTPISDRDNLLERGLLRPMPLACAPVAADAAEAGGSLAQVWGDLWEWTASAYLPYPGFRTSPGAVGEYNGKFMCNQFVLRGGSFATSRTHIRSSYRNFFPPEARWQFSGLRLARDAQRTAQA